MLTAKVGLYALRIRIGAIAGPRAAAIGLLRGRP